MHYLYNISNSLFSFIDQSEHTIKDMKIEITSDSETTPIAGHVKDSYTTFQSKALQQDFNGNTEKEHFSWQSSLTNAFENTLAVRQEQERFFIFKYLEQFVDCVDIPFIDLLTGFSALDIGYRLSQPHSTNIAKTNILLSSECDVAQHQINNITSKYSELSEIKKEELVYTISQSVSNAITCKMLFKSFKLGLISIESVVMLIYYLFNGKKDKNTTKI